jgi:hypothetical protein
MNLAFIDSMTILIGTFEIIFGFALCFVGARFLLFALRFLAFFTVFYLTLGLGNVFFNLTGANKWPLIIISILALIFGCVGGRLVKHLT